LFFLLSRRHSVFPRVELRIDLGNGRYRIPDVALYRPAPTERVPSFPPLVAAEVISPDDSVSKSMGKLREYRAFGIPNIWVIDPNLREFWVFDSSGLREVSTLTLPEYGFEVKPSDLFSIL
jgi:Uma2 family endonuclease